MLGRMNRRRNLGLRERKERRRRKEGENEGHMWDKNPGRYHPDRHRGTVKVRCTEVRKVISPETKGK